jgi:hypothetical protein
VFAHQRNRFPASREYGIRARGFVAMLGVVFMSLGDFVSQPSKLQM